MNKKMAVPRSQAVGPNSTRTNTRHEQETDVLLIGGGIMSATLGTWLQELEPDWSITMVEQMSSVAEESSNGWNNAGTGHAALMELNYTPQTANGINIDKAVDINEAFHISRQFWAHQVTRGVLNNPKSFINSVPHMSFVWGEDNVNFLRARYAALQQSELFRGIRYSEDHQQIKAWAPLVMEGRDPLQKVAGPLTEWEAEQERIKAEEAMNALHVEALAMNEDFDRQMAARIESDHEMALLMNDAFDREQADKAAEAERQRIAHEEEIKRLAAAAAAREVEQRAQREREEAAHREAVLKAQAEQAERDRIAAEQKAEADKKAAVEAERRKAQEEADRIRREAEQREQARLAEEKRKADEQARREADVKHRKAVGTEIVKALLANTSLTRDQAIEVLTAVKDGRIPHTGISY